MASTIPNQERVVDPFASYASNVVNRLTELVTHNEEGMLTVNSMQVELDSTSPLTTVIVGTGYAIKDDVLIKFTQQHIVDFTDDDQWETPPDITFPGGNCYVVLKYQYLKQRPAPQAEVKILQPSERGLIGGSNSNYLLLKVVETSTTSPHNIVALYDADPQLGYISNARKYIRYYAGGEVNLPIHNKARDQGRIAYESTRNRFYFGYESEWGELTAGGVTVDISTDTTGVFVGQLCYVNSLNQATPAISTSLTTGADMIITQLQTTVATGRGIVSGYATQVPVETGIIVGVGDLLYLSETEAGTVTNVRPSTYYQVVGRALSSGSSTTPIHMIFSPKLVLALSESGQISTWSGPDATGYYHDIDVSSLDGTSAFDCHWFDDATNREIRPAEVEIRNTGDVIRVYFTVNTLTVNYMIQSPSSAGGGGSGGGGTGSSDHSLLLNLDYGSSGHTGFAPDPHGNGSHSETYITAAGVTYGNLNANGDVGDAAGQVAVGNHTHNAGDTYNYNDVPTGSIILFESDVAITGYSLLTDQDDMVVYITKGSAAGGETGGTLKSAGSWTQPNHTHGITAAADHTHTTGSHALTISEMPAHTHTTNVKLDRGPGTLGNAVYGDEPIYGEANLPSSSVGGGATHNHGATGMAGNHDHGGNTQGDATVDTWRPRGRNLTRQQKI